MPFILEDLGGLFLLIEVIVFITLFIKIGNLRNDLEELKQSKVTSVKPQKSQATVANSAPNSHEKTNEMVEEEKPGILDDFVEWIKQDFLMKVGALLILLAIAWFVRYSFMNNWIGPMGRITLGMLSGTGILAGGYFTIKKRPVPGQVLVVLGTTTLLLTIFAARSLYGFFTPAAALVMMSFVILLTAVISVIHRSLALSVIALVGGVAAPLMTGGESDNRLVLTAYMFLLDLGVFGVVAMRGWRSLVVLALLATWFYGGGVDMFSGLSDPVVWGFGALFYGLFFVGSSSAIMHSKKVLISDLITILGTVLLAILWTSEYIPTGSQGIVLAVVAIASMFVSLVFKSGGLPAKSIYLHSAAAIILLGAASVFEFDGEILTIVFSLEALAFTAMAAYLLKDKKAALTASVLQIVPGILAVGSLGSAWRQSEGLFNENFFVLLVVAALFVCTALVLKHLPVEGQEDKAQVRGVMTVHIIAATIFLFGLLWRSLEVSMLGQDYAHGVALVIYAVIGLTLLFNGMVKKLKDIQWGGIAVLVMVMLRLLFVEIWAMSLAERIITFVVIGALFIFTAFFEKRSNH